MIKIIVTRCYILRLKCTKFDFGWGSDQVPWFELRAHNYLQSVNSIGQLNVCYRRWHTQM